MSLIKFVLKSLRYYKKQHIAIFFGTLISTAILTGALIIGDSVKYTLKYLAEKRLGNVSYTLVAGERYVSTELADNISEEINSKTAAVLMLSGIAINTENKNRINKVQVLGVVDNFWELSDIKMPSLENDQTIISDNIAKKLNVKVGDVFLLRVQNAELIPLNAPFVDDETPSVALRLTVKEIVDENNLARFSLQNNQTAPYNVFVSHKYLSKKLELKERANLILVAENSDKNLDEQKLDNILKKVWQLKDAGLLVKKIDSSQIFELQSERIFIDHSLSNKITDIDIEKETVLTYFVNSLQASNNETPYSFVTAASESLLKSKLLENEIIINNWLAEDLSVNMGDTIKLNYFVIGSLRTLEQKSKQFIIKDIVPINSKLFDKTLMPEFPGLSDAGNCSEWETSIPIDLGKIRDKDEEYWENYRGTPKALISIDAGLKMWDNKYGNYTSIRYKPDNLQKAKLENLILNKINPKDINLSFQNVRSQANIAASNGVDFGELFISLSFFIIAAALLLTILIYTLQIENRISEKGILSAIGFSRRKIIASHFSESIFTIILGSIVGGFVGILYNKFLIYALSSIWIDAVNTNILKVYINWTTVFVGVAIGIIIALLSIYIVIVSKLKKQVVVLIKNKSISVLKSKKILNTIISIVGIGGSIALICFALFNSLEQNPALFFIAGTLFLIGGSAVCSLLISPTFKKIEFGKIANIKIHSILQLAIKNAGRNRGRSIAVVVLLALGTFTIIVTGANRATFHGTENQRNSGTGGFLYWAESSLPIIHNLNTEEGRQHYGLEAENILDSVNFIQFHNLQGDDASCLNLNQVKKPKILGINPLDLQSRQAFSFAKLLNKTETPWLELNKTYDDNIIPAIADQTVIQWSLIKKIGDTLNYTNENGQQIKLLLVGGLNSSIFQGNILIADSVFMKHFPSVSGSKTMLIEANKQKADAISKLLNNSLSDYGIEIDLASERLARFYSVTNTYLSVFMLLGGLGVILGTFGLGIVLIRNIQERKHEIALLQSIGYQKNQIFNLIFTENLFLLISGIIIGSISALIVIMPSLISAAYNIPSGFMLALVLMVFISGLLWIYFPAKFANKQNFIKDLREE